MKLLNILLIPIVYTTNSKDKYQYLWITEDGSSRGWVASYDDKNFYMSFSYSPYSVCKLTEKISNEQVIGYTVTDELFNCPEAAQGWQVDFLLRSNGTPTNQFKSPDGQIWEFEPYGYSDKNTSTLDI